MLCVYFGGCEGAKGPGLLNRCRHTVSGKCENQKLRLFLLKTCSHAGDLDKVRATWDDMHACRRDLPHCESIKLCFLVWPGAGWIGRLAKWRAAEGRLKIPETSVCGSLLRLCASSMTGKSDASSSSTILCWKAPLAAACCVREHGLRIRGFGCSVQVWFSS